MKGKRYPTETKIRILREAEGRKRILERILGHPNTEPTKKSQRIKLDQEADRAKSKCSPVKIAIP